MNAESRILSKPIRAVLRWQLIATAGLALAAGWLAGAHGALSACLGGAVSILAGTIAAAVASRGRAQTAGAVLVGALTAEGVKLGLIAVLVGLVFATYDGIVVGAFLGSFVVTVLIFSMAFFVRDES